MKTQPIANSARPKSKRSRLHPFLKDAGAVVFDAGGTLVHPDWLRLAQCGSAETGRSFTHEEMRGALYETLRLIDAGLQMKNPNLQYTRRAHWLFLDMFRALGLDESTFERLTTRIDIEHQKRHLWSRPDSKVRKTLSHLKRTGRKIAVISNTEDGRLEDSLRLAGIISYFDLLIDSESVGLRKPGAAIFRLAAKKLAVAPREAVYVGDSYGHDFIGARSAGFRAILLDHFDRYEHLGSGRIRKLSELIDFR